MLQHARDSSTTAPPQLALTVRDLGVRRENRTVLRGVSFSLQPSRTLALVGPNGGGKTSLLRALLGLLPSAGEVCICGLSPRRALRRGDLVGYVPQSPPVPLGLPLTSRQVVRLAVSPRGGLLRRAAANELAWAEEVLARIAGPDAGELAALPITRLSGGQLQQVFLARALANRPRLLLLDEPTIGLDRAAVARLIELLGELRAAQNLATLIATHDHLTAMAVADELVYLDMTVQYRGPADALPRHLDARLCHHDHVIEAPAANRS